MKNVHNTIKSIVVTRIDNRSKKREGGKKKEEWKDGMVHNKCAYLNEYNAF